MKVIYKATVRIEMLPLENVPQTTEETIRLEREQARLDAYADSIARHLDAVLNPIGFEEAMRGAVLLSIGRDQPSADYSAKFDEAMQKVTSDFGG